MILEILKLIVFILKIIYTIFIALFTYLYDFNSSLMKNVLKNFSIFAHGIDMRMILIIT